MKRGSLYLIGAGFGTAGGLAFFSVFQDGLAELLLSRTSYYIMALLLAGWCFAAVAVFRDLDLREKKFLVPGRTAWVFCGLLTAVVLLSVPVYHRIQIDDADLAGVARSFFFDQRADFARMTRVNSFGLMAVDRLVPARPLFFPFLTQLLYCFGGAQHGLVFVLNAVLLPVLLLAVYQLLHGIFGRAAGAAAVLLAAAQPVVAQGAAAGGYDLFFALMVLAALLFFWLYVRRPGPERLAALWMQLLVLANTRYEGPLYLVLIAAAVLISARPAREWFSKAYYYALTPFFLLPTFWQRFFVREEFYIRGKGDTAFSLNHVIPNFRDAAGTLADFSFRGSYPAVINWLGLAGFLVCLVVLLRRWKGLRKETRALVLTAAVCLAAYGMLLLLFANSNVKRPSPARLYILAEIFLTVSAAAGAAVLLRGRGKPGFLIGSAAFLFFLYHPVSVTNEDANNLTLPREERIVAEFLQKEHPERALLIHQWPRIFTARGIPAVDFQYANRNRTQLLRDLKESRIGELIAVQEIRAKTGEPLPAERLHRIFPTETLYEIGHRSNAYLRISRVRLPEPRRSSQEGLR